VLKKHEMRVVLMKDIIYTV